MTFPEFPGGCSLHSVTFVLERGDLLILFEKPILRGGDAELFSDASWRLLVDALEEERGDNGPELVSAKLVAWCERHDIRLLHIQPGRSMQNGYVERFNRSFRNEVLDAHVFASLSEVREHVHQWLISYNEERPHASLGNIPPTLFRQQRANRKTSPESSV